MYARGWGNDDKGRLKRFSDGLAVDYLREQRMNPGMESRKKFEEYVMYGLVVITIMMFIFFPTHADSSFYVWLNGFLDKYLFGNGYYKPTAYPFAAKATNSLSVVLTVIVGIWMGIFRRHDVSVHPKKLFWPWICIFILTLLTFWTSMFPQHFSVNPPKRSFGLTESFHNNPFLFMMLMFMKNGTIYIGFRVSVALFLFILINKKKR